MFLRLNVLFFGLVFNLYSSAIPMPDLKQIQLETPLYNYFSRVEPNNISQLITQAKLTYMKKVIQNTKYNTMPLLVLNSSTGGNTSYIDIPVGKITNQQITNILSDSTNTSIVKLNGRDVINLLERSASQYNTIKLENLDPQNIINPKYIPSNFYTLNGGISFKIDLTQLPRYNTDGKLINSTSYRVIDLMYNNHRIDDDAQFLVIINNNILGNGNYQINRDKIIFGALASSKDILNNYLITQNTITITGNKSWIILPIPGIVMYFATSSVALKYLPLHSEFKKLKVTPNSSMLVSLK